MTQKHIWMAVVHEIDEVVFCRACHSELRAQKAIVTYLRHHKDFDGFDFDHAVFWIGDNDLKLDVKVFAMQPEDFKDVRDVLATVCTDPPPSDHGIYRVIYAIDINAATAQHAAKAVYAILRDPDSQPPVLDVTDRKGNTLRIDLSNQP